jgi:outer membrane protein
VKPSQRPGPAGAPFALGGLCALLAAGLFSGSAQAQAAPASADTWNLSVGVGALHEPRYPGSGEMRTTAVPLFSAARGRFFMGTAQGTGVPFGIGAHVLQGDAWRVGVALGGDPRKPRQESDSPRLRGLGDIDGTALASVFAGYGGRWFEVRGAALTDIGGQDHGTRVSLGLAGRFSPSANLVLSAGPGLTWADRKYTQTFFGIDAEQSARSGLAAYSPGGGAHSARFTLGADYRLSPNWALGSRVTTSRLRGDARTSPITEREHQTSFTAFATYHY